jgi:SAM-dependent methyltransferase
MVILHATGQQSEAAMTLKQIQKAFRHPDRVFPFVKRVLRDRKFKSRGSNFLNYYAQVVDDDAVRVSPNRAIGSFTQEHWIEIGKMQFDYLVSHGLQPSHRFLDIGCGNLRLGSQLIPYLDCQLYTGIDISARIVTAALDTVRSHELQAKLPYIFLVSETNYSFFPKNHFDVAHAHSVFSHLPIDEIEKVLRETWRVLKPGGWFDFTFRNREKPSNYLEEDFDYPCSTMLDLARRCGFSVRTMDDWIYSQDKIRATKPSSVL